MAYGRWCFIINAKFKDEAEEKAYHWFDPHNNSDSFPINPTILSKERCKYEIERLEKEHQEYMKWEDENKKYGRHNKGIVVVTTETLENAKNFLKDFGIFRADTKEAQRVLEYFNMGGEYSVYSYAIFGDKTGEIIQENDPRLTSSDYFVVPAMIHW